MRRFPTPSILLLLVGCICGFTGSDGMAQVTTSVATFQQGTADYAAGSDARLTVSANLTGLSTAGIDGSSSGDGTESQYFLTFGSLFGSEPGQIPAGATILDAAVNVVTPNGSNDGSGGYFLISGLTGAYGSAASLADLGNTTGAPGTNGPTYANGGATLGAGSVRAPARNTPVTVSLAPGLVQSWADGELTNNGIVFQAQTTDAWIIAANANATVANRPQLSVTYTTEPTTIASVKPGVAGYGSMAAITLHGVTGATSDVTAASTVALDGPDGGVPPGGSSPDLLGLIKFDGILGSAADQIPTRAAVAKSWLVLTTGSGSNDQTSGPYGVYQMLSAWDASSTYAGFGETGPVAGTDYVAAAAGSTAALSQNAQAWIDVSSAVTAWKDGAANNGLLIRAGTTDGWTFGGGGNADANRRPELRTAYVVDSLVWKGSASSVWDRGTAVGSGGTDNWLLETAATATNFIDTDRVVFDDSADGSGAVSVAVDSAVAPQLVTFANDARDYTLAGAGGITGAGRLIKTGAGSVTLATDNDFTGGTTVSGGTLRLGAGGSTGSLAGDISVAAGAQFVLDRSGSLDLAGSLAGAGELTQAGSGRISFTAPTDFTGPISVEAGTLVMAAGTAAGGVSVTGGGFGVSSGATVASFTTPTLSLANAAAIGFELASPENPTVTLLEITQADGLSLGGDNPLSIATSGALGVGRFTLIDYSGSAIGSGFTLAPLPQRLTGSLVYDTDNTTIDLEITAADSLRWTGSTSSTWDSGTAIDVGGSFNWVLASSGTTVTNFFTGDKIAFDDTAASGTVAVVGDVAPGSILFDNASQTYVLGGSGAITGAGGLTKQGAGLATVLVSNASTGSTTVDAGTLQLGDDSTAISYAGPVTVAAGLLDVRNATLGGPLTVSGGSAAVTAGSVTGPLTVTAGTASFTGGSFSGGATVDGGRLAIGNGGGAGSLAIAAGAEVVVDNTSDLTFTDVVSGLGSITKQGTGRIIFTGSSNGFTGSVAIDGGEVRIEDQGLGGDFGAAVILVNDGGTFQFGNAGIGNPDLPGNTIITANSGGQVIWQEGEDLGGIQLQGGSLDLQQGSLNATGSAPLSWTSGVVTGGTYAVAGSAPIVKTTAGEVLVNGSASITTTGGISIEEGTLRLAAAANIGSGPLSLGAATSGGSLAYEGGSVSRAGVITLAGEGTIAVSDEAATLTLPAGLVGSGGLVKTGAGTLALTAAGSFTGGSTVSEGSLVAGVPTALGIGNVMVGSSGRLVVSTTLDLGTGNAVTTEPGGVVSLTSGGSLPLAAGTNLAGFTTASAASSAEILAGTVAAGGGSMEAAWLPTQVGLFADVLDLTTPTGSSPFVLSIGYSPTLDSGTEAGLVLGWNATSGGSPTWVAAVDGNLVTTATGSQLGYVGSFADFQTQHGSDLALYVGAYGRDPLSDSVWAVVDHNSQFSIVPEPAVAGLVAFTALAALAGARRVRRAAAADRDASQAG
ncbi:MAG: hypothetical protein RLZZ440_1150 [Planctomycetota bacterium]